MNKTQRLKQKLSEVTLALENHSSPKDPLSQKVLELLALLQDETSPSLPVPRLTNGGQGIPLSDSIYNLLYQCQNVDIISSFVRLTGVNLIKRIIKNKIIEGANCRILTGDYLGITQPKALFHLLNLQKELQLLKEEEENETIGKLEIRVIETKQLKGKSFHPKAWIFDFGTHKQGFVGSSNLSYSALKDGIEWNLHLSQLEDPDGFEQLVTSFQDLWNQALSIDFIWVKDYEQRLKRPQELEKQKEQIEITKQIEPRPLQLEALKSLKDHRNNGFSRGLVQMATGLGKTWLANFDIRNFQENKENIKVLWIAHRIELLSQAADTFRNFTDEEQIRFLTSDLSDIDGNIIFASIQKLSKKNTLHKLKPTQFDYIVVDEVHHAYAPSYQRVLDYFKPKFLLGLTATPHRGDNVHVSLLFDNRIVFKANLKEGIETKALVPFHYYGLVDSINYEPIPWRSGKFDSEKLLKAQQTKERFEQIWEAWQKYPAKRTLVFCCSIKHSNIMANWLKGKGINAGAVHSGKGSMDRSKALQDLASGELQAICTVDLFNEGVDIPEVERVIFLRPTSSRVILLQQLGRGLRVCDAIDKKQLIVIDFVGNHSVFVDRIQNILDLGTQGTASIKDILNSEKGLEEWLPKNCLINLDLEVKDILSKLTASSGNLDKVYQELKKETQQRPTPKALLEKKYNPNAIPKYCSNWFFYTREQDDLSPEESEILWEERSWFDAIWKTRLDNKTIGSLQQWVKQVKQRPTGTISQDKKIASSLEDALPKFVVEEGTATYNTQLDEPQIEFWKNMSLEILDYQVARTGKKVSAKEVKGSIIKLNHNSGTPILKFGSRKKYPHIPDGLTKVRLPNQEIWVLKFMKIACNVAKPLGEENGKNQIARLFRSWFGEDAGHPGTSHQVHLYLDGEQWCLEPWNVD